MKLWPTYRLLRWCGKSERRGSCMGCICMHIKIHICHICAYMCMCMCKCTCMCTYTYINTDICIYTHRCIHIYIYTHSVYIYIYIFIHTHTECSTNHSLFSGASPAECVLRLISASIGPRTDGLMRALISSSKARCLCGWHPPPDLRLVCGGPGSVHRVSELL